VDPFIVSNGSCNVGSCNVILATRIRQNLSRYMNNVIIWVVVLCASEQGREKFLKKELQLVIGLLFQLKEYCRWYCVLRNREVIWVVVLCASEQGGSKNLKFFEI